MIKNMRTNEVVEEYELEDYWYFSITSKLLSKESKYNCKYIKGMTICLVPYSNLFKYNTPFSTFNSKKFSIV